MLKNAVTFLFCIDAFIFLDLCSLHSNCMNMATFQDYVIKKEYIYVRYNECILYLSNLVDRSNEFSYSDHNNQSISKIYTHHSTTYKRLPTTWIDNLIIFRIYSKFVCTYINAICIAVAYKLRSENNYDAKIFAKIRNVWTS